MRAEKKMILYISNEDMNDIIKIIKSFQDSNVFIDRIPETVKHKTKKPKRWISSCFVSAFISRFISTNSDFFSSNRCKWKKG